VLGRDGDLQANRLADDPLLSFQAGLGIGSEDLVKLPLAAVENRVGPATAEGRRVLDDDPLAFPTHSLLLSDCGLEG
jgi:hypothetical protein